MAHVKTTRARLKRAIVRLRRDGLMVVWPGARGPVQTILAATHAHTALVRVRFTRGFWYIPFPRMWEARGIRYVELAVPQADLEMRTNGKR